MGVQCGQCADDQSTESIVTEKERELVLAKPSNTLDFNIFEYVDDLGRHDAFISLATQTICVGPLTVNPGTFLNFLNCVF
jgi:hypothetical protein